MAYINELHPGEIASFQEGQHRDKKFIVVSREPPDRSSGVTTIAFEDGSQMDVIWDRCDLEIKRLGKGRLVTQIIMD